MEPEPANHEPVDSVGGPRPWEEPGQARRDCLPHRGPLLQLLGWYSLVGGVVAVFCLPPLGLAALLLALLVWATARKDLADMRSGERDPEGIEQTEAARRNGLAGAVSGVIALCVLFILLYSYGLFD